MQLSSRGSEQLPPRLWKTIGDEIVFCCRVRSLEHLCRCVSAFLQTLFEFGRILDGSGGHLDVKGCGWVASFPTPNVALAVSGRGTVDMSPDYPCDEEQERACDAKPEDFDFLGMHMDTGFRLSRLAEADRFVTSVELAYLLCDKGMPKLFQGTFDYHGRECLKGVLAGRPYPIVYVDTERSLTNRDVRSAERALLGRPNIHPDQVRAFLENFLRHERIELPALPRGDSPEGGDDAPASYLTFRGRWEAFASRINERLANEAEGARSENAAGRPDEEGLPPALRSRLDKAGLRRRRDR